MVWGMQGTVPQGEILQLLLATVAAVAGVI
jgi:hypothetical protein